MKYIIPLTILTAFFVSCEKELDFHYHDVAPQLVIEATVSDRGTNILLTNTTPMGEAMNLTPLTDAEVIVTDMTDGHSRTIVAGPDGAYTDDMAGIEGHEYRINVNREGRSYESSCTMRPAAEILALEFQWIKMPYDYVAVLQVSFTDPDTSGDYYWVRLLRNGEPYMWSVTDDSRAVGGVIHEVIRTSRKEIDKEDDKTVLRDGDRITAIVAPVSRDMADYLTALEKDSNGPRMFSGDFCLGYFLAASLSESEIIYRPDEMKEYK